MAELPSDMYKYTVNLQNRKWLHKMGHDCNYNKTNIVPCPQWSVAQWLA